MSGEGGKRADVRLRRIDAASEIVELPLRALRAKHVHLTDIGEENAPDLPAPRRASALGAGEVKR
jgi:hypothetical protein